MQCTKTTALIPLDHNLSGLGQASCIQLHIVICTSDRLRFTGLDAGQHSVSLDVLGRVVIEAQISSDHMPLSDPTRGANCIKIDSFVVKFVMKAYSLKCKRAMHCVALFSFSRFPC
jgi:hypothetical protein